MKNERRVRILREIATVYRIEKEGVIIENTDETEFHSLHGII